jgi:hypothetical protein
MIQEFVQRAEENNKMPQSLSTSLKTKTGNNNNNNNNNNSMALVRE